MPHKPIIAGIILAAGSSTRFGADNKLLATIDGRPLVTRVIEALEAGGIARLVVVTGHEPDLVAAATAGPGRRITYNERHARGMGTSVAAGIKALDDDVAVALIAQGDMPAVDATLIANLCRHFGDAGCDRIVHPVLADGRQGNPVIWPPRLFAELRKLGSDKGAKALIEAEGDRVVRVPVAGDGAGTDIDTREDLFAYVAARTSQPR